MFSIWNFSGFCKNKMGSDYWLTRLSDKRKRPQIAVRQIAWTVVLMVALKVKSILQLDQWGRRKEFKVIAGSSRKQVATDSTLERRLPEMNLAALRGAAVRVYRGIRGLGLSRMRFSSGRRMRVGVVDGSGFGQFHGSVVAMAGKDSFPLDVEIYAKKGKELPGSRKVLKRITRKLGRGWCDLMLGDGLYMVKDDFRACKEDYGCDLLVKTEEEDLEVIEDAKGLFKLCPTEEVQKVEGMDETDLYRVEVAKEVEWDGLEYKLTVARVWEKHLKPIKDRPEEEEFWVITTNGELDGRELREAAHARWSIENLVFKRLNSLVKSKLVHTHNRKTLTALLLLWFIGLSLLNAFMQTVDKADWKQWYGKVRFTLEFFLEELKLSLMSPPLAETYAPG